MTYDEKTLKASKIILDTNISANIYQLLLTSKHHI